MLAPPFPVERSIVMQLSERIDQSIDRFRPADYWVANERGPAIGSQRVKISSRPLINWGPRAAFADHSFVGGS